MHVYLSVSRLICLSYGLLSPQLSSVCVHGEFEDNFCNQMHPCERKGKRANTAVLWTPTAAFLTVQMLPASLMGMGKKL